MLVEVHHEDATTLQSITNGAAGVRRPHGGHVVPRGVLPSLRGGWASVPSWRGALCLGRACEASVKLAGAARAAGDVEGRVWLETRDRERRGESEVSLQTREVQRGSHRCIYGAIIDLI